MLYQEIKSARARTRRSGLLVCLFVGGALVATPSFAQTSTQAVAVGFSSTGYSVREGDSLSVCVAITSPSDTVTLAREFSLQVATRPGTAGTNDFTNFGDFFNPDPKILTFGDSTRTACFDLATTEDEIAEETEALFLDLTRPPANVVINPAVAAVTIADNDLVTIGFEAAELTVAEGLAEGPSTATVCAQALSPPVIERNLSLSLRTTDGTTSGAADYTAPTTPTVALGSSVRRACLDFPIVDDDLRESDEFFTVDFSGAPLPTTVVPGAVSEVRVTIVDDDASFGFERTTLTVAEGAAASACISIDSAEAITATVRIGDGSATSPDDYTPGPVTRTLVLQPDSRSCVEVATVEDDDYEYGGETFTLSFVGAHRALNPASASVTVVIDDGLQPITIGSQQELYRTDEDSGGFSVCMVVTDPISTSSMHRTISLRVSTVEGSASEGTDYVAISNQDVGPFHQMTRRQCFAIEISDDSIPEGDESFTLAYALAPGVDARRLTINPAVTRAQIADNDAAEVAFDRTALSVSEGAGAEVCVITTDPADAEPLGDASYAGFNAVVNSAPGSASAADFTAISGLSVGPFNNANRERCFRVQTTDDDVFENRESFTLSLGLPAGLGNVSVKESAAAVVVTIEDNELLAAHDADGDGLLEVDTLEKLNAIRWDTNGDGAADSADDAAAYAAAFPGIAPARGCPPSGCFGYELTADLDFNTGAAARSDDLYYNANEGWLPIGSGDANFAATFRGNGHVLSNLYIRRDGVAIGLFEELAAGGRIESVGIVGADMQGNGNAGAIAAVNRGTIAASYALVEPGFGNNNGPITGINRGTVVACYADRVIDSDGGGALVGDNFGVVSASYTLARNSDPSGVNTVGFLGSGGVFQAVYYDRSVSGVSPFTGRGSEARTTTQLQSPTGYTGLYAGWNVDTDGDGTPDNPWDFGTALEYPALRFARFAGAALRRDLSRQRDRLQGSAPRPQHDADGDGLIEVDSLEKLNAMRWDVDGDGVPAVAASDTYVQAFPSIGADGCACTGYELSANLDFDTGTTGVRTDDAYYNDGAGWSPIGTDAEPFDTVFRGNGHLLENLYARGGTETRAGLFGALGESAHVEGVGLIAADVSGALAGALAGSAQGGVVANFAHGHVRAETSYAGCLIGRMGGGLVISNYAACRAVSGPDGAGVGGLIGAMAGGALTANYAAARVTASTGSAGGLVGSASGGSASANFYDSAAAGVATSARGAARSGAALRAHITYSDDFASFDVDVDGDSDADDPWDFGSARQYPVLKLARFGDAVARQRALLPHPHDLDRDRLIEVDSLAGLNAMRWDLDGDGAADDAANAAAYAEVFPDMDVDPCDCIGYELTASLDFDTDGDGAVTRYDAGGAYYDGGAGWLPIGTVAAPFNTVLEGNGHTIANLTINRTQNIAGLFGRVGAAGVVRNLGLIAPNVTVVGNTVGALAGNNSGAIYASYVAGGNVRGGWGTGGLVGYLVGTVTASYTYVAVSNTSHALGGLVGAMGVSARIAASYAIGSVSSSGDNPGRVGGLVGHLDGASTGRTVTASYWDTGLTGQSDSRLAGANGTQTTTALRTPTSYSGIYATWNLDLDGDGTPDNPWAFGDAFQFPVLRGAGHDVAAQFAAQPSRDARLRSWRVTNLGLELPLRERDYSTLSLASQFVRLVAVAEHPGASAMQADVSRYLPADGTSGTYEVTVTAEDGVATRTYGVILSWDGEIALSLSGSDSGELCATENLAAVGGGRTRVRESDVRACFTLELSLPSGQTLETTRIAVVTIESAATVGYDAAEAGLDFVAATRRVAFSMNANSGSHDVFFDLLDDRVVELRPEQFRVVARLADDAGVPGDVLASTYVDLVEDDVLRLVPGAVTSPVAEDAGVASVCVRAEVAADEAVDVIVAARESDPPSARAGLDFVAAPTTLTFAANSAGQTRCAVVPIIDDELVGEGDETFVTSAYYARGVAAGLRGADVAAVVIIRDDEPMPERPLRFDADAYVVAEGNAAAVTVRLAPELARVRGYEADGVLTVVAGSARPAADYRAVGYPFTLRADQGGAATVRVATLADDVPENAESFTIIATSEVLDAETTALATAVVTIDDDDALAIALEPTAVEMAEGNAVTTRAVCAAITEPPATAPMERRFSLTLAAEGSATLGGEYDFPATLGPFDNDNRRRCGEVALYGDAVSEDDEYFTLRATPLPPRVTAPGDAARANFIIRDDDDQPLTAFARRQVAEPRRGRSRRPAPDQRALGDPTASDAL